MSFSDNPVSGVTLEDIRNLSGEYRDLFPLTDMIEMKWKGLIDRFYSRHIQTPSDMYRFVNCVEYNSAVRNYRQRFMVVSVGSDRVFVPLKVVQAAALASDPENKLYFQISHRPISMSGSDDNIELVLDALKSLKCVHTYVLPEVEGEPLDANFYNTRDSWVFMDENKWKRKRKINLLSDVIEVGTSADIEEINRLSDYWLSLKRAKNRKFHYLKMTDPKLFDMHCRYPGSVMFHTFRYRGILIGYVFINDVVGKYVSILSRKNCCSSVPELEGYLGFSDENTRHINSNLGSWIEWWMHRHYLSELDYDAIFSYSATYASLRNFKSEHFRNRIVYNKLDGWK